MPQLLRPVKILFGLGLWLKRGAVIPPLPNYFWMSLFRMMNMTDFNIFNTEASAEKGATLHILHPVTLEPVFADDAKTKTITIELMGVDSKTYQKALQDKVTSARKNKADDNDDVDFDKILAETVELYADMTVGWSNISHEGKALPFNRKNAVLLYTTYKEIRTQAGDFMAKKANFIKG